MVSCSLFFTLFNAFADNKKYGIINQNNMKLKTFIAMGLLSMFSLGSPAKRQHSEKGVTLYHERKCSEELLSIDYVK